MFFVFVFVFLFFVLFLLMLFSIVCLVCCCCFVFVCFLLLLGFFLFHWNIPLYWPQLPLSVNLNDFPTRFLSFLIKHQRDILVHLIRGSSRNLSVSKSLYVSKSLLCLLWTSSFQYWRLHISVWQNGVRHLA